MKKHISLLLVLFFLCSSVSFAQNRFQIARNAGRAVSAIPTTAKAKHALRAAQRAQKAAAAAAAMSSADAAKKAVEAANATVAAEQAARAAKFNGWMSREITALQGSSDLALEVAELNKPFALSTEKAINEVSTRLGTLSVPQIIIETQYKVRQLPHPAFLWGPYNGLKHMMKLSNERGVVAPEFRAEWHKIRETVGYRGAHHIVNKSFIKVLYDQIRKEAMDNGLPLDVKLSDMENNAPAAFHPYHGLPQHAEVFHNLNEQIRLYHGGGVKAIIMNYFAHMHEYHVENPNMAPAIPQETVANTLKEAQLWAETYHLRWE